MIQHLVFGNHNSLKGECLEYKICLLQLIQDCVLTKYMYVLPSALVYAMLLCNDLACKKLGWKSIGPRDY